MKPSEFIQRYKVRCFYHFTDTRNLPSIRANGGLLRLSQLIARKIAVQVSEKAKDMTSKFPSIVIKND